MPPKRTSDSSSQLFGFVIQTMRGQYRWTLQELAKRTGMNPNYLSVLERGGNSPTLSTITRLAWVFGIEASELLRRMEESRRSMTGVTSTAPQSATDPSV